MAQMEPERATLLQACLAVVDRLAIAWGWQLLGRVTWAQQAVDLLQAHTAADPPRAAMFVYSQVLHSACSGTEGRARQNLAYSELFHFLFESARRRYPDIAEDATQHASERVFALFARCRTPGTFLAFALQQLMDSARVVRRQSELETSLPALTAAAEPADLDSLPARQPDMDTQMIAAELRTRFEHLSTKFLSKHPRAGQQIAALRLKYIDGLDEATISQLLGKSVGSVYTLRARAVEKLRAEPEWRVLAADFGILPEE
ncbi:MAG: sigma-70 family RNA polymerase sigma factor [Roseiflexaceae bacterium]